VVVTYFVCSCERVVNEFVSFETMELSSSNTEKCVEYSPSDPCCNETLEWQTCCDPEVIINCFLTWK
jgi:hypothetical protein